MRIALAQINPVIGDFENNRIKIIEYSKRAKDRRADIVLFPEASLFGYHPMDLLERASIVQDQIRELKKLIKEIPDGILVVFGAFTLNENLKGKPYFNSAIAAVKNKIIFQTAKELLPTYGVFDDARHIEPGKMAKGIFKYKGKKILITICEDIWAWPRKGKLSGRGMTSFYPENPLKKIKKSAVDLVLNLSASPFHEGKIAQRRSVVRQTALHFAAPMAYVNIAGAQDELIFDGGSFAVDAKGKILAQNVFFNEDINVVDLETKEADHVQELPFADDKLREALVLGIRDFIRKTGHKKIHLGLSGGIDSAIVACLSVDAIGSANVTGFALPGPFSSDQSLTLAQQLAKNLNIEFHSMEIKTAYDIIVNEVNSELGEIPFGVTNENIQARLRSLFLMAYANRERSLLLNTTNKSEMACGYGTLYGDLAGGLSPIGDLSKGDVYRVARLYNKEREIIPTEIIRREPTAELRPNQKDSDSLPPYNELDKAVERLIENTGVAKSKTDRFVLDALKNSEYKRWQAAPILKVRERSFGRGRRMPIAHRGSY